ncbi:mediator of RNA polymerase II transcription subunit 15 [Anopheles aquasalis]|uniref:mediator of RNA polymerase II transcription subunit 15 n=1 Tax=Anopheles aquasalis TaxID=42839 RepID=UPI00215B4014|nr:mediator of RNA polymerase II transcription subunit 15 [Anopheles aquasalis]
MFNDRKLTPGHGFVKAYSNNWLSHLGSVYKYESPKDVLRKPSHQHRKIALYSILAMAFVAFFTLFMIVHEADRKMRRQVIVSSFDNETAIEPSAGGLNTVLTTPFSSSGEVNRTVGQESRSSQEASEVFAPPKRTRRLRYYGEDGGRQHVGRDQLVLHPARTLNPPAPQLVSSESEAPREMVVASRRFDEQAKPIPFHVKLQGPVPVGFQQQQQQPQQQHPTDHHDSRANRSVDGIGWGALNIQDVIRQLTLAKRQQQQQQQLYYPYKATAVHPSEFNHPVYQNHRVKFTGIYRHPRKNGDITTLFGAASKRPQEVVLQAPQLINQQLQHLMPDPLYNFKPQDPSDVNLLATEQFRFAPQEQQQQQQPRQGMPFSVMLNLEPMPIVGRPVQQQRYRKRFQNQYRNQRYLGQPWNAGPAAEQSFAQLSPYRTRPIPNNPYGGSAEYDDRENYFRRAGHQQHRQQQQAIPAFASPMIGPGRLMIHFNIFPKQQPATAQRKSEVTLASGELNTWEERTQDLPPSSEPTHEPTVPSPWIGSLIDAREPSVPSSTTAPTPTVEVIKSIEIPTQINFDHVPLGRHPPPTSPRPPTLYQRSNPWAGDEAIWGKH